MPTARSSEWIYVSYIVIAMFSTFAGASLAKSLFSEIGAAGAVAIRLAFGSLILVAVFRPWRAQWHSLPWLMLLGYGTCLGMMNLLFYTAISRIPIGIAIAIQFTGPLALAILGSRRPIDFLWVALAVAGLLLLAPWSQDVGSLDTQGVISAIGAGICWALYIVFGQRAGADHGSHSVAIGALIASAITVPWGVYQAGSKLLSLDLIPVGLGLAVLAAAVPFTLEMKALKRIPASTFGLLMSLEPAAAALCGLVFLHEQLSGLQWMAIAAVMVASFGAALSPKPVFASAPCAS